MHLKTLSAFFFIRSVVHLLESRLRFTAIDSLCSWPLTLFRCGPWNGALLPPVEAVDYSWPSNLLHSITCYGTGDASSMLDGHCGCEARCCSLRHAIANPSSKWVQWAHQPESPLLVSCLYAEKPTRPFYVSKYMAHIAWPISIQSFMWFGYVAFFVCALAYLVSDYMCIAAWFYFKLTLLAYDMHQICGLMRTSPPSDLWCCFAV